MKFSYLLQCGTANVNHLLQQTPTRPHEPEDTKYGVPATKQASPAAPAGPSPKQTKAHKPKLPAASATNPLSASRELYPTTLRQSS